MQLNSFKNRDSIRRKSKGACPLVTNPGKSTCQDNKGVQPLVTNSGGSACQDSKGLKPLVTSSGKSTCQDGKGLKPLVTNLGESAGTRQKLLRAEDDPIVFVPTENIRAIERVIDHWEAVKQLIIRN